jgi:hypothetical protein
MALGVSVLDLIESNAVFGAVLLQTWRELIW